MDGNVCWPVGSFKSKKTERIPEVPGEDQMLHGSYPEAKILLDSKRSKHNQLLQYKKMLRKMPIHERVSLEREKNVLLIWEKRNRWALLHFVAIYLINDGNLKRDQRMGKI